MHWFTYFVVAFMVVCVALSVYRMRRNGPGPAVNYVPSPDFSWGLMAAAG